MAVLGTGAANLTHWGIPSFGHAIAGVTAENTARRPPSQLRVLSSTIEKHCPKSNTDIPRDRCVPNPPRKP